jgi:hypothetical protein
LTTRPAYVPFLFVTAPADIDDLALLAEFAELAMARARAASARAEAVEAEGGDPSVHVAVFDRMGRAMRLALSLRRRFIGEAEQQAGRRVQARKERLKAALTPAIRVHAPFADRQDLDWALAHRLETEADALAALPFAAGVARLTRLLGLPVEAPLDPPQGERDREAVEGVEAHSDRCGPRPPQSAEFILGPASGRTRGLTAPPEGEHLKVVTLDRQATATGPP